jgi:lysyl-tRNA synthetase class 2
MVNMNVVTSSYVGAVGYDGENKVLYVQFRTGKTYKYSGVQLAVYDSFLAAESKGKYFAGNIRNHYQCAPEIGE